VLCIGIGIAANTAVFDISSSTLYPDTPIQDRDRIVRIYTEWATGEQFSSFSWPDYMDVRDGVTSFESAATHTIRPFNIVINDTPERIWGAVVTGNYFGTLGIDMIVGRDFSPEEDATPGTHPVLLISHALWQSHFGADPGVIGTEVLMNRHPFTIIGVVEKDFRAPMVGMRTDLYAPMMMYEQAMPGMTWMDQRASHWLQEVSARLRPGVTFDQAEQELKALFATLQEEYPVSNQGKSTVMVPEIQSSLHPMVRPQFQGVLMLLTVVVGLVLLLACANVAGLILARSSARRKEMGIRLALGADRGRLIRQVLAESVLLALIAGVVGFMVAQITSPLSQASTPQMDIPMEFPSGLNLSTLWFAPLLAVLAGLLFGLIPALEISRHDIVDTLKVGRVTTGRRTHRLRSLLVGGQVALSLVLLIGAGLVIRSLGNAAQIYPGFDAKNQIVAALDLDLQGYDEEGGRSFYRELNRRLVAIPGISAAGKATLIPLNLSMNTRWAVPEGWEGPEEETPAIGWNVVDEGYFDAMGIPVSRGRAFVAEDDAESERVLVVNQTLANMYWPGEDPLTKTIKMGKDPENPPWQVVGIVPAGKYFTLGEEPKPFIYAPYPRIYAGGMSLHIRTQADPAAMFRDVERTIHELDPDLPISNLSTMEDQLDFALLPARLVAWSVTIFAVLALLLASVGLYGQVAYSVSQKTREIGIRVALGADPGQVLRFMVRSGMTLVIVGLAFGLGLGLLGSWAMTRILYGLPPVDPAATAMALIVLGLTALLASYLPARRATKVDPITALGVE
jgi:predicted permease